MIGIENYIPPKMLARILYESFFLLLIHPVTVLWSPFYHVIWEKKGRNEAEKVDGEDEERLRTVGDVRQRVYELCDVGREDIVLGGVSARITQ